MQTSNLLTELEIYGKKYPEEIKTVQRLQNFIKNTPTCFERTHLEGHVTGSGLVTDYSFSRVLLTHHAKLNKWLQFGGHSDGHPVVYETALRECEEESGIKDLTLAVKQPEIFDIDIHLIPERKNEPQHFHYDIRYLVLAGKNDYKISEESKDVRWFSVEEAKKLTSEPSMQRLFKKLEDFSTKRGL